MASITLSIPTLIGSRNYEAGDVVDVDANLLADLQKAGAIAENAPATATPAAEVTAPLAQAAGGGRFNRFAATSEQPAGEKTSAESTAPASDLELLALDADVLAVIRSGGVQNINHLRDIASKTDDLTKLPGVGKATAAKIKSALDAYAAEHPAS